MLSTTLYINGHVEGKVPTMLVPLANGSNYSSNTGFTGSGWFGVKRDIMEFVRDVKEDDMLTTEIKNKEKFDLSSGTIDTTFTISLKNNSQFKLTNGTVTVTDGSDSNMNAESNTGVSTTLEANATTSFSATINFPFRKDVETGSYITYTISYKLNGDTISYKYRVLVVG